jgi:sugar lactone lactonase YvrE
MRLRKLLALAFAVIAPLAASAQNISTVAGGGPINLDPLASSVGSPVAVRQDSAGNTYILDNARNRIYKIAVSGPNAGKLTVFAGNGKGGYNGNGGLAVDAEFSGPIGMCMDSHDNVWVADSDNGLMRKILVSLTGANPGEQIGHVYDIVGVQTATNFLFGGDGGPMANANLHFPDGCGFDTSGNLYIADRGNNAIRIAITGTPFGSFAAGNIYSFVSAGDGVGTTPPSAGVAADGTNAASAALNGPYDVFVDANNNVFIGLVGNPAPDPPAIPPPTAHLVRVIWAADHGTQLAGKIYTVAGAVSGGDTTGAVVAATSAALSAAQGISVDSNGNLIFCDPGNNVVREVPSSVAPPAGMTPGNIYIIAGNFGLHGYAGDGNLATDPAVRLANPVGTFLKGNGDLLIADSSGTSVRLVDHATADISTFAGNGHVSFGGDGGPAVDAQLNAPAGLATFSTFDLVIADFSNKLLRGVKASDSTILTITGQPEFDGYFGNGISATGATIKNNAVINTNNVWLDSAGNGYLADTDNCVVRKIDTSGIITTIAGTVPVVPDPINAPFFSVPQCGFAGAGGPALSAKLGKITGVAADSAGNVYFADSTNNVIWVLWKATTTSPARTGGNVYIVSTGTTLNSPTGMFVDSYGNVYFADTNRHVIRQISAATGTLTVFAGTDGSAGFSPDGTAATSAQLKNPFGVFVDGAGNVFISDTGNNVIREVPFADGGGKTKGSIYTVVGTSTAGFNGDGIPAKTAEINSPQGLAQGPANSLYFSDSANNRVRSVANLTSNPLLTVSKLILDFGNQAVLIPSAALTITVKNTGAATITLNTPQITGTNSADFAFTNHCAATLASGAACTVDVKFTPSVTAAETATLTISDTVPESRAIDLKGTGVVGIPGASVTPTTLPAFALQAVGTTSATGKNVTVTNNGTAVLNFTAPTPFTFIGTNSGDFTQTTTCGATLAVGASCTITVKFAPAAAGTRTASLSIADNAPGSPQLVAVSGTAAVPTADLSGTTITFPDQTINTSSATKTATLTNNGTVPLTLNPAIAITGDFSQTNDCVSPIAASAHCTITVTFTPTAVGARTGTITISDNASPTGATTTQTVALSGNGLSPSPTVTLAPATLPFPDQLVGVTSTAQTLTLTNTGSVAFTVPTIIIGGLNPGDFSQTNNCGATLAVGANCAIGVKFTPTAAGRRAAFISLNGQTTNFSGNGVIVALGAAPNGSTSQTVKAGATATYALQLTAVGGQPTDSFSVSFSCAGAPSKATCTVPANAVTVTPAAATPVTVTISTTAASMITPLSEPNMQSPTVMRFLPLTIVSLLLCIAMMLAWMQNPAGRIRAVRFAVTACLVLMPIAMGAMLTGCASAGGSSSTPPPTPVPGTPAGTYTVNVTSTVSGQTSTTPLTLIVQ